MRANDVVVEAFERVREIVRDTVDGLDADALAWRPDERANSVAWLVWHLTRVQDDHMSEIAGHDQVWVAEEWAQRFGLPAGSADTGFGYSPEQVAAIRPAGAQVLVDYQDRVADRCKRDVEGLGRDDFERVIDASFDPPVTVGVRLVSVIGDALQHAGQAAYVRGLYERRA